MNLNTLGWDDAFRAHFEPYQNSGFIPARVIRAHKRACEVISADGPLLATCTGRLLHETLTHAELPAVGDWVVVRPREGEQHADIHAVLPRRTKFSRRAAGDRDMEQIVAANIDTVFLVTSLDDNYNLRRIERFLITAWESGAQPVVVLNKTDLHPDPAEAIAEVVAVSPGASVIALSARNSIGLEALDPWLTPGSTIALLGSSGVGKSTIINRILGEDVQDTGDVSLDNGKGRHTTTRRELLIAPSGALVIDTPGMRELQFWQTGMTAVGDTFDDVRSITEQCKFHDCQHNGEPGCAVQRSLEDGTLEESRWESYLKLQSEQAFAARQADASLARAARNSWKKISQQARARSQADWKRDY